MIRIISKNSLPLFSTNPKGSNSATTANGRIRTLALSAGNRAGGHWGEAPAIKVPRGSTTGVDGMSSMPDSCVPAGTRAAAAPGGIEASYHHLLASEPYSVLQCNVAPAAAMTPQSRTSRSYLQPLGTAVPNSIGI